MARIRSIKPEFWKSEAIACHDFFTRLVFIGLWSYVDDNGVGIDNYRLIAAELFPLEDDFASVARDLRESLARLADAGRIRRYTVGGKAYVAIVNWSEHQKIDRPNKPRYPEPDDPRSTPTPPTSPNTPPRESLDEPSRESRATPSSGTEEQRNRGTGDKPSALASLDASAAAESPDVIDGEVITNPDRAPSLFVVPDQPGTDLAVAESPNAGQINRQWIDYCAAHDVKLTNRAIKRYGAAIKDALSQNFHPDLIKRALAQMLDDRVTSRPALFDNYIIRAQQGPELPPRRASRADEAAARLAPAGMTADQHLYDILTRPA